MRIDWRAAWAIMRKDIRSITANNQVWAPMLIVPLVLGTIVPGVLVRVIQMPNSSALPANLGPLMSLIERIKAPALQNALAAMSADNERIIYLLTNYAFAAYFLLIPLMASCVVAADSFAGEKERGTLESLLYAPVNTLTLFAGKLLASFLPAMFISLGSFIAGAVVINVAGWPLFGRVFFPEPNWLPLMLLVIPALSLGAILFNVYVSARTSSFQAAYQIGPLVILPVLGLLVAQVSGALLLGIWPLLAIGLLLVVIDATALNAMLRRLGRASLFETQVR